MLFNSHEFLLFFPIVVLLYFLIPLKSRQYWLLFASYFFYACWNVRHLFLLFFSTVVTYLSGLAMGRCTRVSHKKLVVTVSFILNLSLLVYYKYFNFGIDCINSICSALHIDVDLNHWDILLPVGISFYTLQALGYTMDVYRGDIETEKNFFKYALFVSFFPQLVAGPIERSRNLLNQLSTPGEYKYENVREGLITMLWGFFLKLVIADRAAIMVDTVYGDYLSYSGYQLIAASVAFAFQVYCDFMSYSTIAKGAARVLGYSLMDNFRQPFFSQSTSELWRRWHISLGTWLRDYLYFPLGGSRCSKPRKYFNLMVTCLASGLWHGANITYCVWGGLNGLYQIIEDMLRPLTVRINARCNVASFSWRFVRTLRTFILFVSSVVFFRAAHLSDAVYIIKKSFDLSDIGMIMNDGLLQIGLNSRNMCMLLIGVAALFLVSSLHERRINVISWLSGQNLFFRLCVYWGLVSMILLSVDLSGKEFIYFAF